MSVRLTMSFSGRTIAAVELCSSIEKLSYHQGPTYMILQVSLI